MKMFPSTLKPGAAVFAVALVVGSAAAGPLNPGDFPSLGTLNLPSGHGDYYLNTTGPTPTLKDSNGNVIATGMVYNEGTSTSPNNVAVFDFNSITIGNGNGALTVYAFGANPVALLSQSDFTIDEAGISEFTDYSGINGVGGLAGPAAGPGGAPGPSSEAGTGNQQYGNGPGGGEAGAGASQNAGGGGGFGGAGGAGYTGAPSVGSGGAGGVAYGDLHNLLQGGSSGGMNGDGNLWAGGGGGAVELGAVGTITLNAGVINMDGGSGPMNVSISAGNGGGSGGAVFIHGNAVNLTSDTISARGGDGGAYWSGSGFYSDGGGGGGGGRILIQTAPGGYSNADPNSTFDVQGGISTGAFGTNGENGANGVVTIEQVSPSSAVPEPSSLTLLCLGAIGLLGFVRRRG